MASEPGGAYDSYSHFPSSDEAVVAAIFPVVENQVIFTCEFERRRHSYHYFAPTEKIATQVHDVVSKNLGKILSELGDFYSRLRWRRAPISRSDTDYRSRQEHRRIRSAQARDESRAETRDLTCGTLRP